MVLVKLLNKTEGMSPNCASPAVLTLAKTLGYSAELWCPSIAERKAAFSKDRQYGNNFSYRASLGS